MWAAAASKLVNDAYISFPIALLPLLAQRFDLSLTAIGLLTALLATSSMLVQPVFGLLADWRPTRGFVVISPVLTIICMSLIIVAPSYEVLAVLVVLGGLGTASFNPQAAALVSAHAASRPGVGIALLTSGGQLGRAIGPIAITTLVVIYGSAAAWYALLPVPLLLAATVALIPRGVPPRLHTAVPHLRSRRGRGLAVTVLCLLVAIRALTLSTYMSFMPILLSNQGESLQLIGIALALFQFAGALGGLAGGIVAHRIGYRAVILFALAAPIAPLWLLPSATGWASLLLFTIGAATLMASVAVNVSFALEIWPQRGALVSGIMIGLGWGLGGALAGAFGALGDTFGLAVALRLSDAVLLIGIPLALLLPRAAGKREPNKEPVFVRTHA